MDKKNKVNLGILSFAHVHAPSYARVVNGLEEAKLVGIYDNNEYRGKRAAAEFTAEYYSNLKDLLKCTDGVIICSENVRHKELAIVAANNNNHILCEKPIATTLEDADEIIQTCEKNKVKLCIAFPMRYSVPIRALKERIENGENGNLLGISSTNRGKFPSGWFGNKELAGGGAIIDHTVHLVDLFRWIFKKEVKKVYAETGTLLHPIDVEDCGLLSLEFEDGSFATLDCSWSRPKSFPFWGDVTMRVYETKGVINIDAFKQQIISYNDERVKSTWHYWGTNPDLEMIKDFVICIKENRPISISGEDGKKALAVVLAAYSSIEKGEPVSVRYE
jgi:predicted dehydrogenase